MTKELFQKLTHYTLRYKSFFHKTLLKENNLFTDHVQTGCLHTADLDLTVHSEIQRLGAVCALSLSSLNAFSDVRKKKKKIAPLRAVGSWNGQPESTAFCTRSVNKLF